MARPDTDESTRSTQAVPSRDLVVRDLVVIDGAGVERASRGHAAGFGRPRAEFLAQLMVSVDPAMRQTRCERTRVAAMRYAEAARRRA